MTGQPLRGVTLEYKSIQLNRAQRYLTLVAAAGHPMSSMRNGDGDTHPSNSLGLLIWCPVKPNDPLAGTGAAPRLNKMDTRSIWLKVLMVTYTQTWQGLGPRERGCLI